MDAKRGDIGTTAARHAVALFDRLGADAVTVSPYVGSEALGPLLERADRFAYVLCRTSNPGAGEFQALVVEADPSDRRTGRAAPLARRTARRELGTGRRRSGWSSARPPRPSLLPSGPSPRGSASWCPASGRRAGRSSRSCGTVRRRPTQRVAARAAASSSTSRVASPVRCWASRSGTGRPTPASAWRRLPATGLRDSLCYPSRRTNRLPATVVEARKRAIPPPTGAPRCCRISEPQSSSSS